MSLFRRRFKPTSQKPVSCLRSAGDVSAASVAAAAVGRACSCVSCRPRRPSHALQLLYLVYLLPWPDLSAPPLPRRPHQTTHRFISLSITPAAPPFHSSSLSHPAAPFICICPTLRAPAGMRDLPFNLPHSTLHSPSLNIPLDLSPSLAILLY